MFKVSSAAATEDAKFVFVKGKNNKPPVAFVNVALDLENHHKECDENTL